MSLITTPKPSLVQPGALPLSFPERVGKKELFSEFISAFLEGNLSVEETCLKILPLLLLSNKKEEASEGRLTQALTKECWELRQVIEKTLYTKVEEERSVLHEVSARIAQAATGETSLDKLVHKAEELAKAVKSAEKDSPFLLIDGETVLRSTALHKVLPAVYKTLEECVEDGSVLRRLRDQFVKEVHVSHRVEALIEELTTRLKASGFFSSTEESLFPQEHLRLIRQQWEDLALESNRELENFSSKSDEYSSLLHALKVTTGHLQRSDYAKAEEKVLYAAHHLEHFKGTPLPLTSVKLSADYDTGRQGALFIGRKEDLILFSDTDLHYLSRNVSGEFVKRSIEGINLSQPITHAAVSKSGEKLFLCTIPRAHEGREDAITWHYYTLEHQKEEIKATQKAKGAFTLNAISGGDLFDIAFHPHRSEVLILHQGTVQGTPGCFLTSIPLANLPSSHSIPAASTYLSEEREGGNILSSLGYVALGSQRSPQRNRMLGQVFNVDLLDSTGKGIGYWDVTPLIDKKISPLSPRIASSTRSSFTKNSRIKVTPRALSQDGSQIVWAENYDNVHHLHFCGFDERSVPYRKNSLLLDDEPRSVSLSGDGSVIAIAMADTAYIYQQKKSLLGWRLKEVARISPVESVEDGGGFTVAHFNTNGDKIVLIEKNGRCHLFGLAWWDEFFPTNDQKKG